MIEQHIEQWRTFAAKSHMRVAVRRGVPVAAIVRIQALFRCVITLP